MFPPRFDYEAPDTLDEALSALEAPGSVVIAGGHDLIPALKRREAAPSTLVDIDSLDELRGIDRIAGDAGERLSIGALTTDADLLAAAPTGIDALLDATEAVGDAQIRTRGTVGGNLAAAHPASDIPAATVAADATLHLVGPDGDREMSAEEFATGDHETVLADDELLTRISVPIRPGAGGAYARETHPSTGYASVGVAARLRVVDGMIDEPRVAAVGLADAPVRLPAVEDALEGADAGAPVDAVERAAEQGGTGVDAAVREDHIVSAEQRRALLPTYTEESVSTALARAVGREGVVA